jgi:hypothetical protein
VSNKPNPADAKPLFLVTRPAADGEGEEWAGGINIGEDTAVLAFGSREEADKYRIRLAMREGVAPDALNVAEFNQAEAPAVDVMAMARAIVAAYSIIHQLAPHGEARPVHSPNRKDYLEAHRLLRAAYPKFDVAPEPEGA